MEDSLTDIIDNSQCELIKLVKQHVEAILHKYFEQTGILLGYELRDDAIVFTCNRIAKSYLNDSRYKTKKDLFIKTIARSYIFGTGLENSN